MKKTPKKLILMVAMLGALGSPLKTEAVSTKTMKILAAAGGCTGMALAVCGKEKDIPPLVYGGVIAFCTCMSFYPTYEDATQHHWLKRNFESVCELLKKPHIPSMGILLLYDDINAAFFPKMLDETIMWAALRGDYKTSKEYQLLLDRYTFYQQYFATIDMPSDFEAVKNILIGACLTNDATKARDAFTMLNALTNEKILKDGYGKKFDINTITFENESLLHHAARQNNSEIVKLLIKWGHHVNALNPEGLTAFNIAEDLQHNDTIDALLTSESIDITNSTSLQSRQKATTYLAKATNNDCAKVIMSYLGKDDIVQDNTTNKNYGTDDSDDEYHEPFMH